MGSVSRKMQAPLGSPPTFFLFSRQLEIIVTAVPGLQQIFRDTLITTVQFTIFGRRTKGANEKLFSFTYMASMT